MSQSPQEQPLAVKEQAPDAMQHSSNHQQLSVQQPPDRSNASVNSAEHLGGPTNRGGNSPHSRRSSHHSHGPAPRKPNSSTGSIILLKNLPTSNTNVSELRDSPSMDSTPLPSSWQEKRKKSRKSTNTATGDGNNAGDIAGNLSAQGSAAPSTSLGSNSNMTSSSDQRAIQEASASSNPLTRIPFAVWIALAVLMPLCLLLGFDINDVVTATQSLNYLNEHREILEASVRCEQALMAERGRSTLRLAAMRPGSLDTQNAVAFDNILDRARNLTNFECGTVKNEAQGSSDPHYNTNFFNKYQAAFNEMTNIRAQIDLVTLNNSGITPTQVRTFYTTRMIDAMSDIRMIAMTNPKMEAAAADLLIMQTLEETYNQLGICRAVGGQILTFANWTELLTVDPYVATEFENCRSSFEYNNRRLETLLDGPSEFATIPEKIKAVDWQTDFGPHWLDYDNVTANQWFGVFSDAFSARELKADYEVRIKRLVARNITTAVVGLFLSFICTVFVIAVQIQQTKSLRRALRASRKHLAASHTIIEMASEVVKRLTKYDTDGVANGLQKYREAIDRKRAKERRDKVSNDNKQEDALDITERLIDSFSRMNENLMKYKPYLPNFLFLDDDDDQEDDENEEYGEDELTILSSHHSGGGEEDEGSLPSVSINTNNSNSKQSNLAKGKSKYSAGSKPHAHGGGAATNSLNHNPSFMQGLSGAQRHMMQGNTVAFRGKISMGLLDISLPTGAWSAEVLSGLTGNGGPGSCRLPQLIDFVYLIAKQTKASVHSMLGDKVQLTWNATHRTPNPEAKACMFLLKLRASLQTQLNAVGGMKSGGGEHTDSECSSEKEDDEDQFVITGAVASGVATVHSITTDIAKQVALIIDSRWTPVVDGCFQIASRYKTFVVCENTHKVASYDNEMRPIDRMQYEPGTQITTAAAILNQAANRGVPSEDRYNSLCTGFSPGFKLGCDDEFAFCNNHHGNSPQTQGASLSPFPTIGSPGGNGGAQGPTKTTIYELLQENQSNNDEWMYNIQDTDGGAGGGSGDISTNGEAKWKAIFALASVEGKYQDALNVLDTFGAPFDKDNLSTFLKYTVSDAHQRDASGAPPAVQLAKSGSRYLIARYCTWLKKKATEGK